MFFSAMVILQEVYACLVFVGGDEEPSTAVCAQPPLILGNLPVLISDLAQRMASTMGFRGGGHKA